MAGLLKNKKLSVMNLARLSGESSRPGDRSEFRNIAGGGRGMTATQIKQFRNRETAKVDSVFTSSRYS